MLEYFEVYRDKSCAELVMVLGFQKLTHFLILLAYLALKLLNSLLALEVVFYARSMVDHETGSAN